MSLNKDPRKANASSSASSPASRPPVDEIILAAQQRELDDASRVICNILPQELANSPSKAAKWYRKQQKRSTRLKESPLQLEPMKKLLALHLETIKRQCPQEYGHPQISLSQEGVIEDCRSSRNTRVNGVNIKKPKQLRDGSIVETEIDGTRSTYIFNKGKLNEISADYASFLSKNFSPRKNLKIVFPVGLEQHLAQARAK